MCFWWVAGVKAEQAEEKVKRERKVYGMPGQTKETPPEVRLPPNRHSCELLCSAGRSGALDIRLDFRV